MNQNRRNFLTKLSVGAVGFGIGIPGFSKTNDSLRTGITDFNMCGYAAEKLDTVRVGIKIGAGTLYAVRMP